MHVNCVLVCNVCSNPLTIPKFHFSFPETFRSGFSDIVLHSSYKNKALYNLSFFLLLSFSLWSLRISVLWTETKNKDSWKEPNVDFLLLRWSSALNRLICIFKKPNINVLLMWALVDWAAAVPWWAALWLLQRTARGPALPGAVGVSTAGTVKCPPRHKDAALPHLWCSGWTDLHTGHCQCRNGKILKDEGTYCCLKFNRNYLHSCEYF